MSNYISNVLNIEPVGILGSDIPLSRAVVSCLPGIGLLKEFTNESPYSNYAFVRVQTVVLIQELGDQLGETLDVHRRAANNYLAGLPFEALHDAAKREAEITYEEGTLLYNKIKRGRIVFLVSAAISTVLTLAIISFATSFFAALLITSILAIPLGYQVKDFIQSHFFMTHQLERISTLAH